jgi:prepilin-type N-terminal cleavage/methylation domain-containing protein
MSARGQPSRGFTLIELVVTVAIVALLSTVAFPLAEVAVKRSKEQELRLALREIRSALDAYMQAVEEGRVVHPVGQSAYPESLDILVDGVPDASSPDRKRSSIFCGAFRAIRCLPTRRRRPGKPGASAATPAATTRPSRARMCTTCIRCPRASA